MSKRLTPDEWVKAKSMWRSGRYTLDAIATQVGCSRNNLHRRFTKEGIEKGEDIQAGEKAIRQSIENTTAQRAEELGKLTVDIKEETLKAIRLLNKRVMYEIGQCAQQQKPFGMIKDDVKTLHEASKMLGNNYSTAESILGINKDDLDPDEILPEMVVRVMNQDDVAEIRAQQEAELALIEGTDVE